MGKVPIIECRKEAGSQPDPNPFWEISRNLANLGRRDVYVQKRILPRYWFGGVSEARDLQL